MPSTHPIVTFAGASALGASPSPARDDALAGGHAARQRWRPYVLDGAQLLFHPASGTSVRVRSPATRAVRRAAPRVVMFGITNACNLRCGFCSRDLGRPSRWTAGEAAAVLRDLSRAGTLEVAFGGGEPFAFAGFADLIAELYDTTPLALSVTTNGTLLRRDTWPRFAGRLASVRLSLYPDTPSRRARQVLAGAGQRWGANVLVDAATLDGLPDLLAELAAEGAADASILAYVGAGRDRLLDPGARARLADLLAESPLPSRLSVCFGDAVPVSRLETTAFGDCGAGRDFVSITPDRRVQACSFADVDLPGDSAAAILDAWRARADVLAAPSPRIGCARGMAPPSAGDPQPDGVAIWQGFSGNNSGECVLVAHFETVASAERYLAIWVRRRTLMRRRESAAGRRSDCHGGTVTA